jgi:hypothetical protein
VVFRGPVPGLSFGSRPPKRMRSAIFHHALRSAWKCRADPHWHLLPVGSKLRAMTRRVGRVSCAHRANYASPCARPPSDGRTEPPTFEPNLADRGPDSPDRASSPGARGGRAAVLETPKESRTPDAAVRPRWSFRRPPRRRLAFRLDRPPNSWQRPRPSPERGRGRPWLTGISISTRVTIKNHSVVPFRKMLLGTRRAKNAAPSRSRARRKQIRSRRRGSSRATRFSRLPIG